MFLFSIIFIFQNLIFIKSQIYDSNTIFANKDEIVAPNKYMLYWNFTNTEIIFKLVVKHTGWIGFGLSPNGGMDNSDIVISFKNSDGSFNFTDRSAFSKSKPTIDKYQDYKLLFNSQINGITTVIFQRFIKICNDNPNEIDMDIETGTNFVIFAWGNLSNNDIDRHYENKLAKSIPLISTLAQTTNFDPNDKSIETYDFTVNVESFEI